jgi:hypothetical protein
MTDVVSEADDTLVERVRKLLDKAESTDNAYEAEAFSAKAADLIARHRIDPARLDERAGPGDDLSIRQIAVGRGAYVRGRLNLLGCVAENHDVRMVFKSSPTGSVAILAGRTSDLDLVEVLYASLHTQVAAQMAGLRRGTGAATQRERRSFLFGFADRIGEILEESRTRAEAAAQSSSHGGAAMALVVRERREEVDEFATESWGRVRSASRPARVAPDGYGRGSDAAEHADVGRVRLSGRGAIGTGGQ